MILEEFSDCVVVDSMIEEYDEDCEYFCSAVAGISAPQLPVKINTTAKIARGMEVYNEKIGKGCFNILKVNEIHRILLCTGTEITVEVFPMPPSQAHVMFFFEDVETSKTALYTGTCSTAMLCSIIEDPLFRRRIADGVDYFYIDNARVPSEHFPSVQEVGQEIANILRSNSNYRIFLHSPFLGYEELLYHLVQQRQIKVYISPHIENLLKALKYPTLELSSINDAKIICIRAIFSYEGIKSIFQKKNVVNVRFTEAMFKPKNLLFKESGIYEINWSPNLNYYDFVTFVRMVAPKEVHGLSYEYPLPDDIKEFSDKDDLFKLANDSFDSRKTSVFEAFELPLTYSSYNNVESRDSSESDKTEYSMTIFCDRTMEDADNDFKTDKSKSPCKEKIKHHQSKDTTNFKALNVKKPKKKLRGPLSRRKKRSNESDGEVIEGSHNLAKIPSEETQSDQKSHRQKDPEGVTENKISLDPTIIIKKKNKLRGPLSRRKKRSNESDGEVIEGSHNLAKIPSEETQSDQKSHRQKDPEGVTENKIPLEPTIIIKKKNKLSGPLSRRKKRSNEPDGEVIEASPNLAKIPSKETQSDQKSHRQKDPEGVTENKISLEPTIIIKKKNKLRGPLSRRKKRSNEPDEEVIEASHSLAKISLKETQSDQERSINLMRERKCNLYRPHAGKHVTYESSDSDE